MSAVAYFDAARALKRELTGEPLAGLSQEEVDALNAIVAHWQRAGAPAERPTSPTGLRDVSAFYRSVRDAVGSLTQQQVDGFNFLLEAMGKARWPISWAAYGLATAWWETAKSMQPVEEAYYLGAKAEAFRKRLRYYPWHGRGYVQLTWERNYERADDECGLDGKLLADKALAMDPEIAAQIMVRGMEGAWFTGKGLRDYLPLSGRAGHSAYKQARRIINGTDKSDKIAKEALLFEAALEAGGWS